MTIRDVADYCGVSVSTVSRVLNNHPDVSAKVRNKVLSAVRELHYVPNISAQDLGRNSSDNIGVVVRGAENPFFVNLIHSIEEAVEAAGYTMIISQIPSDADELEAGASLSRSKRLKGLVFLGGCFNYTASEVAAIDIPFVCCTFTNEFGDLDSDSYSSVCVDDRAEAVRAVRYLIEQGHRRIAIMLNDREDESVGQLRFLGYCDALKEAGIEYDDGLVEETGVYSMEAAYRAAKRLFARRDDFTAVFVTADSLAMPVLKAANDLGRKVPDECSVIGFDGLTMSLYSVPTLTTLVQPSEKLGKEAVQTLLNVIEGKAKHQQKVLKTTLRKGESVTVVSI